MKDAKGHGSDGRGAHAEGANRVGRVMLWLKARLNGGGQTPEKTQAQKDMERSVLAEHDLRKNYGYTDADISNLKRGDAVGAASVRYRSK